MEDEMKMQLPEPVAAYFEAKNREDDKAALSFFADDAAVNDEKEVRTGRDAIRRWLDDTRRYHAIATPLSVSSAGDEIVVDANVAGDFPGSPITLTYRFQLADRLIKTLEIG
jgi:ketosteroid isomerase-like protein